MFIDLLPRLWRRARAARLQTRYLVPADVPALLALEHDKWEPNQAASEAMLRQRIAAHPQLCIGAFCPRSGKALASLFMRPINPAIFIGPTRWELTANLPADNALHRHTHSLFGISLSSNHAAATDAIFRFFYPRALKAGWRDVYLGSPMPGFRRARELEPELSAWKYVHRKKKFHAGEPADPQLSYYYGKGFRQVISIQQDYFPHPPSLDFGVILRRGIPLSQPGKLWQRTPLPVITSMSAMLFELVR